MATLLSGRITAMNPGEPSTTAQYVALFRALESARPPGERLFDDRFASLFLKPSQRWLTRVRRLPFVGPLIPRLVERMSLGAMSSAIGRTRWIDDALLAALRDGVEQVVILGTGFDCRAYRIPGIERVRVFEVDHPDTLARRVNCLKRVFATVPAHVCRVATDFNEHQLRKAMADGRYDPALRTFLIWEGVTSYLAAPAVDATMRWMATATPTSQIVFTYLHRRVLDEPSAFPGATKVIRIVARAGEPWRFGFYPEELPEYLAERGLELVEDVGADEYRHRYLVGDDRLSRGYAFYRVALGRVRS
jgi:methyltransferase (TIGR00027 family)